MSYIINPKNQELSIQVIIDRIEKGFKLQELTEEDLTEEKLIEYNDAIIIAPDYQRDYRSTVKDESSLIESIIVGIPIPPIFLANGILNGVQVMNVIDGQHRLRAFYRFINNKFKLTNLTIAKKFENKKYDDLELSIKRRIISTEISSIVFKDFPGTEFEIEIFNRYNKGTKPLSQQEIRHAVYNSEFNRYVNKFAKLMYKEKEKNVLAKSYNVTKDRLQKKKLQESLFVILSILESGINDKLTKSPKYAENFMKEKHNFEKSNPEKFKENFEMVVNRFNKFNVFVEKLANEIEYPFSKQLYGVSNRNYKFQISIAMIVAGIFHKILQNGITIDEIPDRLDIKKFVDYIGEELNNSFLEDPNYSASSTNPVELIKFIDAFKIEKVIR